MADIDKMLGTIDPRLVVQIITVLPRETGGDGKDDKRRLKSLRKQLSSARRTLRGCKQEKSKVKWTDEVERLQREVDRASERLNGPALMVNEHLTHKRVQLENQLDQAQDDLARACTPKDATRWRARVAVLQGQLDHVMSSC